MLLINHQYAILLTSQVNAIECTRDSSQFNPLLVFIALLLICVSTHSLLSSRIRYCLLQEASTQIMAPINFLMDIRYPNAIVIICNCHKPLTEAIFQYVEQNKDQSFNFIWLTTHMTLRQCEISPVNQETQALARCWMLVLIIYPLIQ